MTNQDYMKIVEHYEQCLARHGDTHLGVDWPDSQTASLRYDVMLGVIRPSIETSSILDFGCGAGHFLDHLGRRGRGDVRYAGLDASERFISLCRSKYPGIDFHRRDILSEGKADLDRFDYVVANGVFTEKRELDFDAMFSYFRAMIASLFAMADVGIAFNVMSSHVDWERDDLFHLPMDLLGQFLTREVTRHFVVRNDYGLYEYTVYAYKEPSPWPRSSSSE